jgi:glutathione S-transferase
MAMALGAAEKGREQVYERAFRPPDKHYEPWLTRCSTQMHGGLGELERYCAARGAQPWLIGDTLGQADITVGCAYTFLREAQRPVDLATRYPRLAALVERCEALPAFKATHVAFFTPGGQ